MFIENPENGEFVTVNGHKIHVYRTGNSNGKQTFKNWIEDQKEFAKIINANIIFYDCSHYIHHYKSKEMSREIEKFVSQL